MTRDDFERFKDSIERLKAHELVELQLHGGRIAVGVKGGAPWAFCVNQAMLAVLRKLDEGEAHFARLKAKADER